MSYTAIFRDGPMGGQTMQVERPDYTLRVPVVPRIDVTALGDTEKRYIYGGGPEEPELYELVGGTGRYLEYRWVNPSSALRRENERLRAQIAKAREALS